MRALSIAAAALALAACTPAEQKADTPPPAQIAINAPSGEYTLDPNHSTVTVRVQHFGLAFYTLRFNTVSGTLNFNAEDPAASSIVAAVATTSLDTPYTGERDFDAELQTSNWLDSATFPAATFRSTAVERTGPNTARVTGDLEMHGITRPLTLDVTYRGSHAQHPAGYSFSMIGFSARGTLLRSQFGVDEMLPTAGDTDGHSDEVELVIEAEFTRPVATDTPGPTTREPVD